MAPQLLESDRRQLDSIVARMVANGESDEDIRLVVKDFKQRRAPAQAALGATVGAKPPAAPLPRMSDPGYRSVDKKAEARMNQLAQIANANKTPVTRVHDPFRVPDTGAKSGALAGVKAGIDDPSLGSPRIAPYDPMRHGPEQTPEQSAAVMDKMEREIVSKMSNDELGKYIEDTYKGSKVYETAGNLISGTVPEIRDKLLTERQRRLGTILGNELYPGIRQIVAGVLNIPETFRQSAADIGNPESDPMRVIFSTMALLGGATAAGGVARAATGGGIHGLLSEAGQNISPIIDDMAQGILHGLTKVGSPIYNKAAEKIEKSTLRWAIKETIKDAMEAGAKDIPIEDLINPSAATPPAVKKPIINVGQTLDAIRAPQNLMEQMINPPEKDYPKTMKGVDPLGLAKTQDAPVAAPKAAPQPKPAPKPKQAPTAPQAPKKAVSEAPVKPAEVGGGKAKGPEPDNIFAHRDALWAGVSKGKPFKDEPALYRSMSGPEWDSVQKGNIIGPSPGEPAVYVTKDADRVALGNGGSYGGKAEGGVIVKLKDRPTVPISSRNVRGLVEDGVPSYSKDDVVAAWDAKTGQKIYDAAPATPKTPAAKYPQTKGAPTAKRPVSQTGKAPKPENYEGLSGLDLVKAVRADIKAEAEKTAKAAVGKGGEVLLEGGPRPNPDQLRKYAIMAKGYVQHYGSKFEDWADAMVRDLGEAIRPILPRLWRDAHKELDIEPPSAETAAAQNAAQARVRASVDLPGFRGIAPEEIKTWVDDAKHAGWDKPENALDLANKFDSGELHTLSAGQNIGVAMAVDDLVKQFRKEADALKRALGTSREKAAYGAMDRTRSKIDTLSRVLNESGTQQARDFVARRVLVDEDGFASMYRKYSKAVGDRELTAKETESITKMSDDIQEALEKKEARIAELERTVTGLTSDIARGELKATFKSYKESPRKLSKEGESVLRAKLQKDIKSVIAKRIAAAQGKAKSSALLGAEVLPEIAVGLIEIAPLVKEYSASLVREGLTDIDAHLKNIVKMLKSAGVEDVDENAVAATLLNRIGAQSEPRVRSAQQEFTKELSTAFQKGRKAITDQKRFIDKREKEVQGDFLSSRRAEDLAMLRAEREALKEEERRLKAAEKAYWKDVNQRQKEWAKLQKAEQKAKDAEYIKWWRTEGTKVHRLFDEIDRKAARAKTSAEKAALLNERRAAEKTLRDAQKKYDASNAVRAKLEREEYIRFWKASVPAKRAAAMDRIERLQSKLADYEEFGIITGQKSKIPPKKDEVLRKLEIEEAAARNRFRQIVAAEQVRRQFDDMTLSERILQFAGGFRSLKASVDNSAPFFQGGWAMFGDPRAWTKAWKDASNKADTVAGYEQFVNEIRSDSARYNRAKAAGVDIPIDQIHPGEEMILHGNWAERIPGVGKAVQWSERQYAAYLTALRMNMFDNLVSSMEKGRMPLDLEHLKAVAKHVNSATGRSQWLVKGDVGMFSHVLFAPKFWGSIIEMGAPGGASLWSATKLARKTGNWVVPKKIAQQYLQAQSTFAATFFAASAAIEGMTGYKVERNPLHTDFGRAKKQLPNGSTHTVDLLPPQIQQGLRFWLRFAAGTVITSDGKMTVGSGAFWDDLARQFSGKLSPVFGVYNTAMDAVHGKKQYGKSYDISTVEGWLNWVKKMGFPISTEGATEIYESDMSLGTKVIYIGLQAIGKGGNIRQPSGSEKGESSPREKIKVGSAGEKIKVGI